MMRFAPLLSVCLPLLLMAAWISHHEYRVRTGVEVEFAVTGFDPRDLLAGHFLVYQVQYAPVTPCLDMYQREQCLCIVPGNSTKKAKVISANQCNAVPKECPTILSGECKHGRFIANIERFYIPESYSPKLQIIPENSSIKVKLTPHGRGMVTDFLVNGKSLEEHLE